MLLIILVVPALVHGTVTDIKNTNVVGGEVNSAALSLVFSDAESIPMPKHLKKVDDIMYHKTSQGSNSNRKTSYSGRFTPFKLNEEVTANAEERGQSQGNVEGRIVGGETAETGSWPWQAGVFRFVDSKGDYYFVCSATLIQSDLIITSAEDCIVDVTLAPAYLISLGTQSFSTSSPGHIYVSIQSIICHPNFSDAMRGSNICLGKLVTSVTFNQYTQPVALPSQGDVAANETCVMTGWGYTSSNKVSPELQQAEVQILSNEECNKHYSQYPNDQFCAGETGVSPCLFDQGNPVVCQNGSMYVLQGITSTVSDDCGASNNKPGLFTNVSEYRNWIDDTASSFDGESAICYDPETIRECGTKITQNGTVLRSPVVDQNGWLYPSDTDCEWSIEAPPGYKIRLEFLCSFIVESTSTSTGCIDDYLTFSEPGGGGFLHCGSALTPRDPYISLTNYLKIEFHSDADNLVAKGFVLRITFEEDEPTTCYDRKTIRQCGTKITQSGTVLRSPTVDENSWLYPSNTDCEWPVEAPPGYRIRLEFLCSFIVETVGCGDDHVTFREPGGGGLRHCRSALTPIDPYISLTNRLQIEFQSDTDDLVAKGFVLRIMFEEDSAQCYDAQTTLRCGEEINDDVTILTSPIVDEGNWVYPRNTDCEWTVKGKSGQSIGIEFLCPFSMEDSSSSGCKDDYLSLIESNNDGSTKYTTTYCGSHSSLNVFNTSSNELKIRFHSDSDDLVAKGFVIKISILGNSGKRMVCCGALLASMFLATFLCNLVLQ